MPNLRAQEPKKVGSPEATGPRRSFQRFLMAVLRQKDVSAAMGYFSPLAFSSPAILSEDCAGYLSPEERSSPEAIGKGVRLFLQELQGEGRARSPAALLAVDRFKPYDDLRPLERANNAQADRFLLLKLAANAAADKVPLWLHDPETKAFLSRELRGRTAYVAVAVLRFGEADVSFYCVWRREKSAWRIIHLDLICQ